MIQDNQIHQDDIRKMNISLEISLNLQIMIQLNMFVNKKVCHVLSDSILNISWCLVGT